MHTLLAARSAFSIGESILGAKEGDTVSLNPLIQAAKSVGAAAVALTDTMSITGMIDFAKRAKAEGIKPIVGCRLRLVDDITWRKTKESKKAPPEYFVTWYVLSEAGLKALFKLLSLANTEDHFYNTSKISFTELFEAIGQLTSADVALSTSDVHSVVGHPNAREIVAKLVDALGAQNVFAALTPIDTPYFDSVNRRAIDLARELNLPTLVSRPIAYGEGGADALEIMNAIWRNVKVADPWHNSPATRDLHAMTASQLLEQSAAAAKRLAARGVVGSGKAFAAGIVNADTLVNSVKYVWDKSPVSLPVMAPDEFGAVVQACKEGWAKRFCAATFDHKPTEQELLEVYRPRLVYELGVLKKLNFSGYFLLVKDVVDFAKSSGILVGPGRGSVGGSLVAYLLGITDCDPIRFGLLFERFINPDRIDLPDADLDFMSARRGEIIEYLIGKYGADRVAGVSNFGTLGSASSIRDVSRVLGWAEFDYRCSKLVPKQHGQPLKLEASAEAVPEIAQFRDKHPDVWKICRTVEGTVRNMAQHAAGIVVGGVDLIERAVVERRKGDAVVNWDKRIVEDMGLVKMDILGLSTLDLIKLTTDYIFERRSLKMDLLRIALDDPMVLKNFAEARTTGVFQFESGGMRRLLKELGQDGVITFEDITACTALYRPGPMESGMMDSYYKRKQGNETVEYDHPLMEPILAPTYGVPVYQEQIMQIARVIAGYTAAGADKLRKIMGKKLPEEMAKERDKFVAGTMAGYVQIELEDGSSRMLHRTEKFRVAESSDLLTIEEIFARDLTPLI